MAGNDPMGCDCCGTHVESGEGHYVPVEGGGDEARVCADCADRVSVARPTNWLDRYVDQGSGARWERVAPLVAAYCEAFDAGEPIETVLADMIADMLHLLDFQGSNEHAGDAEPWDAVGAARDLLDRAVGHWVQERGGVWA